MKDSADLKDIQEIKELKTILFEAEVILNYNTLFLKELEARIVSWNNDSLIGDVMIKVVSRRRVLISIDILFKDLHSICE